MAKQKPLQKQLEDLICECECHYTRWQQVYQNGGSDPTWEDGYNLNLIRNQITYCKKRIEALCGEIGCPLPAVDSQELPPIVENTYMAKTTEILTAATNALNILQHDTNYLTLLQYKEKLSDKEKTRISYHAVIGYVIGLEQAIKKNDYLIMRRYQYYARYQESFRECLEKIGKIFWEQFTDVPVDPETECIDVDFLEFPKGAYREDVWHWFEKTFGLKVYDLLYA